MFSRPTSRWRQKGVISIMAAFSLGVALVIAALALDLGRVYWIKRDLQKVADLASLSAVTDMSTEASARKIAEDIAKANGFDTAVAGNSLTVNTGIYDWTARAYAQGGDIDMRNAVHVTAATTVPYYFQPGSLRVEAKAVSARDAIAGFSLGSYVARLKSSDSPLLNAVIGGLLGGSVDLDIGSYQGLAAANISLLGIKTALNLGTVDEVLNADLLGASITVLQRNGDPASLSAANTLLTLQAAMAAGRVIKVGDVVKLDPNSPSAALNAQLNVLQLLQMGAMVANGGHFIDIPNLGVSLPGVAGLGLKLSVIEPPSIAIGPARCIAGSSCDPNIVNDWVTRAHTAQIRLKLQLDLLGIIHLPIYIEAGAADAALTKIRCLLPKNDSEVTINVNPQLVGIFIGDVSDAVMPNRDKSLFDELSKPPSERTLLKPTYLVNVLGLVTIRTDGFGKALGGGTTRPLVFNGPFDQFNNKSTASLGVGSAIGTEASKPGNLIVHVILFDFDAGPLIDAILNVLNAVLDTLLDPLLSFLGVQLGGADVTAFYLDCGVPQLVR